MVRALEISMVMVLRISSNNMAGTRGRRAIHLHSHGSRGTTLRYRSRVAPILVFDLNEDGRQDLIWGNGHDYGLYWYDPTGTQ